MTRIKIKKYKQLSLPFPKPVCAHKATFSTMAYVPAGVVCADCGRLLFQYIPQPPEKLGYLSADWAWKHKHGNEWTTKD